MMALAQGPLLDIARARVCNALKPVLRSPNIAFQPEIGGLNASPQLARTLWQV